MQWNPVVSSNIEALKLEGHELSVKFKTGVIYVYQNVTPELFQQVVSAESVGKAFISLIRSKVGEHPFTISS